MWCNSEDNPSDMSMQELALSMSPSAMRGRGVKIFSFMGWVAVSRFLRPL